MEQRQKTENKQAQGLGVYPKTKQDEIRIYNNSGTTLEQELSIRNGDMHLYFITCSQYVSLVQNNFAVVYEIICSYSRMFSTLEFQAFKWSFIWKPRLGLKNH